MINNTSNFLEGEVLLINKPYAWTSFDVVNKIRCQLKHLLKIKKIKIGHAGTLDPLATGLLILCTGKFTKKIDTYQELEKEYTGTFHMGYTTPSSDLETETDNTYPTAHLTNEMIHEASLKFIGETAQHPPLFSAKKIEGERAYEYARRGENITLQSKKIFIKEFEITRINMPYIDFRIVCSKGTYIRAIARDFGASLGSGAYLSKLCRTRIGSFSLKDAIQIEDFEKMIIE